MAYWPTNLPYKSTIHVRKIGKYTGEKDCIWEKITRLLITRLWTKCLCQAFASGRATSATRGWKLENSRDEKIRRLRVLKSLIKGNYWLLITLSSGGVCLEGRLTSHKITESNLERWGSLEKLEAPMRTHCERGKEWNRYFRLGR